MSETAARAFLDRVTDDQAFAAELDELKADPEAVLAKVHAEGFVATPDEIRDALIERFGVELSPEQLDAVAAGFVQPGVPDPAIVGAFLGASAVVIGAAMAGMAA